MLAKRVGIAYTLCMQYTLRGIPTALDQALRERAREEGKSLNEVAIDALAEGLGFSGNIFVRRDLNDIAGTWIKDRLFEEAISEQDQIDESLWK